jgi:polyferredoxin
MCVSVCPTGIDIRDGLQLECIACAQCIDACDSVMHRLGRQPGLIRYSSQAAMEGEKQKLLRPRVIIYPALICALLALLTALLATHAPVDVTLLRGLGRPYLLTPAGEVANAMRVMLTNRTDKAQRLHVEIAGHTDIRAVAMTPGAIELPPGKTWTEPVQIIAAPTAFSSGVMVIILRVKTEDGVQIDQPCRLVGPMTASAAAR